MNDSGWRKRQIALDKKAENARELGLDYNKTIMEMAREAGWKDLRDFDSEMRDDIFMGRTKDLEAFAALVRADEREACANVCDDIWQEDGTAYDCREVIRARKQV